MPAGGTLFWRQESAGIGNMANNTFKTPEQVKKFWAEKEETYGGKVTFQTFVTYMGEPGGGEVYSKGGLFFIINDRLHFEDFEKHNALMAMFNRQADYEKTEFSFPLQDIQSLKRFSEKQAYACIKGDMDEQDLTEMSLFKAFFSRRFWKMSINNRPSIFFEVLDEMNFIKQMSFLF